MQVLQDPSVQKDPGVPVQMLKSPNIDRFLFRAQDFLSREDYAGAIQILQDVVEGGTLEEPVVADEAAKPKEPKVEPSIEVANPSNPNKPFIVGGEKTWTEETEDPKNAVFSKNGRLYRPVRLLCHELLANLPQEGLDRYRTQFEVPAERLLKDALASDDLHALEEIYNKYFVTLSAGRALERAGDLLLDRGTFRAAIQTYQLLVEVYPKDGREKLRLSEAMIRFKIALAFQQLGDHEKVAIEVQDLAKSFAEDSLRLMGELVTIKTLPESNLLGSTTVDAKPQNQAISDVAVLAGNGDKLIGLWEHRFEETRPYRPHKATNSRSGNIFFGSNSSAMSPAPKLNRYSPGTSVQFFGDEVGFLDNFRLRVTEQLSGRLLREGKEGKLKPKTPQQGRPRTRIPAYDFSAHRVAYNDTQLFTVIGPKRIRQDMSVLTENHVVAFNRETMATEWKSDRWPDYKEMTFLATPTVFGNRLLVPVAKNGRTSLQCLSIEDGAPLYTVHIHRSGTRMKRPLASPVIVRDGLVYMLTNAGCLASIDAYTGTLRWTRKYERTHPNRPQKKWRSTSRSNPFAFRGRSFVEEELPGFAPSELLSVDGLLIFAPTDGRVLICLDGTTGDPVWMISRRDLQYLIGHDGEHLYVGAPDSVMCIDLHSGIRKWQEDLPSFAGSSLWRGRGTIAQGNLIIPGKRELHVRTCNANATANDSWRRVGLPSFSYGLEPLRGNFNVSVDGPYLALAFEGGIEMYSSRTALKKLATQTDDLLERAIFQSQAGEMLTAIKTLESIDVKSIADTARGDAIVTRLLSMTSELALVMAGQLAQEEAIALLDGCRSRLTKAKHIKRWHLARLEVFRELNALQAIEAEQEALYQLMGKD